MKRDTPSYRGYRFPPEIISHAVWLYHRFCLSFRDVEDLLAQRSIAVSYEAIRLWCIKFGPEYARRLKRRQGRLGDTWHLAAVAYLKRKNGEGESLERVASELGVSNWSLSRWVRESAAAGVLRPVEVEEVSSNEFSLLTPRGYRVEGLSEESVVRLVERLG